MERVKNISNFICFSVFFLLSGLELTAQNLIPNPSFDSLLPNYNYVPVADRDIDNNYPHWNKLGQTTPDILHDSVYSGLRRISTTANGRTYYHTPRTGPGMLGLIYFTETPPRPNSPIDKSGRESVQAKLLEPLEAGATYSFGMYVNIASTSLYTIAPLGVTFTVDSVVENEVPFDSVDYNIQFEDDRFVVDSVGWEYFNYCYKPDSAYNFILISNRRTKLVINVAYYDSTNENPFLEKLGDTYLCFDDLSLIKIGDPFFAAKKRVLCKNNLDSLELSSRGGNHNFWWIDKQNPLVILGRDSVLKVKPARTTTYLVYNDIKDTIEITVDVVQPPSFSLGLDSNLCNYEDIELSSGLSNGLIAEYQWSTNETASSIKVDQLETEVWHQVIDTNGCIWRDTINLTWQTPPAVELSNDTLVCEGETVELEASVRLSRVEVWTDDYNLVWQTGPLLMIESDSTASVSPLVDTYYYATVDDGKCTGNTDSVLVIVKQNPITEISPQNLTICQGVQTEITAAGGQTYLWDIGGSLGAETTENKRTISSSVSTFIAVQAIDAPCRGLWDTAFITIDNLPLTADFTVTPDSGSTVFEPIIQNLSNGGELYHWNFDNGQQQTVTAAEDAGVFGGYYPEYPLAGTYDLSLIAERVSGCADSTSKRIIVTKKFILEIPNAFSPNDDQLNDTWNITTSAGTNLSASIYNRWGELIYQWDTSESDFSGWDGTYQGVPVQDGVYVYVLKVKELDKTVHYEKGTINLVR